MHNTEYRVVLSRIKTKACEITMAEWFGKSMRGFVI